jgi:hypothetical protein
MGERRVGQPTETARPHLGEAASYWEKRIAADHGAFLVVPGGMTAFLLLTSAPSFFGLAEIEFSGGWVLSWIPQPVMRSEIRVANNVFFQWLILKHPKA